MPGRGREIKANRGDLGEKICARIESLRKRMCAWRVIFLG